jgi:hypothetical protein
MIDAQGKMGRRAMLQGAAGLAALELLAARPLAAQATPTTARGQPGDFDFLAGEWRIANRRRRAGADDAWDEFDGEATCWTVLAGGGSIEELRIPARGFSGLGIRLLEVERKVWSDFWINANSGVLAVPGQSGVFKDGAGVFIADDVDAGQPIKVRGVWDRITPTSCRWTQAVSRDDGKTWRDDWLMHWQRK